MEKSEVTAMELVEVKNEKDLAGLMPLLKEIWAEVFTPLSGRIKSLICWLITNLKPILKMK